MKPVLNNLYLFEDLLKRNTYCNENIVLVAAAGFEERNITSLNLLSKYNCNPNTSIILDYDNNLFNEPVRSQIISLSQSISRSVIVMHHSKLNEINNIIDSLNNPKLIVDITGMSRVLIFQILHFIDKRELRYDVVYTEAEIYFPLKDLYDQLVKDTSSTEDAFLNYLGIGEADIVYSSDCRIFQPNDFIGSPEPGRPALLISFLTFRRSRLQLLLQELEFEKKILVLGEPVREDLKWRKAFMEIANFDVIQKNNENVIILNTLSPFIVADRLEELIYQSRDYARYNIFLAPLGSKMQTIGCYMFWKRHPDITIIFSQPKTYYKDKYSNSYRDTFAMVSY